MKAELVIRWALQFARNATLDHEFTDAEIKEAARHFVCGADPWESSAAICEGRNLDLNTNA